MDDTISNEIANLARIYESDRFNCELKYYNDINKNGEYDNHINDLNKIIKYNKKKNQKEKSDKPEKEKITNARKKLNNIFNNVDKYIFQQPWKKLSEHHKTIKLKEFVEDRYLNKTNEENQEKKDLEEKLINALKKNKLPDKYIVYDQIQSKIIEIKILQKDSENKYNLIYNKNKKY